MHIRFPSREQSLLGTNQVACVCCQAWFILTTIIPSLPVSNLIINLVHFPPYLFWALQ